MIKIICLTDAGHMLAQQLAKLMRAEESFAAVEVLNKPKPFKEVVQSAFNGGDRLIFICATGIVLRTLAPVIDNKLTDPAVLVLDERAEFVIPLLSGHEGGANQFAAQICALLDAQLVSTTANAYLQPIYTVGMGCERHCPESALYDLLAQSLQVAGLKLEQISAIASIDIKADEIGLIQLANRLNVPFICYTPETLRSVEAQLETPSDYVFKTVGVYGVAESAALVSAKAAGVQGWDQSSAKNSMQDVSKQQNTRDTDNKRSFSELMLTKQKSKVATCAISRSYSG
jgi:cobalt-precorrin 5A hydrolase